MRLRRGYLSTEDEMGVQVSVIREEWADRRVPLPAYQTAGSAGADICANLPEDLRAEGVVLQPMDRVIVPTGIRVAVPQGFEMQIRPRSGLALKHGITLPNTPGTIDSDYRGEIRVLLINHGQESFTISAGDRIAQLILAPVSRISWREGALADSERGEGGFGSTGRS